MKTFKPHIRLVDGVWIAYFRRTPCNTFLAASHSLERVIDGLTKRHRKLERMRQDREAGRVARSTTPTKKDEAP